MDITYRNRRALIATLPTVEQPQPDAYDTHEHETRVLEVEVAYDDGAALFSGPRRRGYYLHGTVVVIERRPGSGFIGRKFELYKSGRKAFIAEASRFSDKQLRKHAEAVAGSGLVKAVVAQTLDLTGFTLPPSQELADLFGPED